MANLFQRFVQKGEGCSPQKWPKLIFCLKKILTKGGLQTPSKYTIGCDRITDRCPNSQMDSRIDGHY